MGNLEGRHPGGGLSVGTSTPLLLEGVPQTADADTMSSEE